MDLPAWKISGSEEDLRCMPDILREIGRMVPCSIVFFMATIDNKERRAFIQKRSSVLSMHRRILAPAFAWLHILGLSRSARGLMSSERTFYLYPSIHLYCRSAERLGISWWTFYWARIRLAKKVLLRQPRSTALPDTPLQRRLSKTYHPTMNFGFAIFRLVMYAEKKTTTRWKVANSKSTDRRFPFSPIYIAQSVSGWWDERVDALPGFAGDGPVIFYPATVHLVLVRNERRVGLCLCA